MIANKTNLDELDIKFFKEFDFLIDVFTSSFSKLREIILNHFNEIEEEINNFISNNSIWEAKKHSDYFTPFYSSWEKPKNYPSLRSIFTFTKSIKAKNGTTEKDFEIACGFWYDKNYEPNKPFLFFGIYRYNITEENKMFELEFYENLDVGDFDKTISYLDEDKEESYEIKITNINEDEINQAFQIFLQNILKPYLKELEKLRQ